MKIVCDRKGWPYQQNGLNGRPSRVPVGSLLVGVGYIQDCLFLERFASNLEAYGQILSGKTAAYTQRGRTGQTKGRGQPRPIAIAILLGVDDRIRLYFRSGNSHSRHQQHVHII